MKILPLTSILIPENRQRREFTPEALVDLANSLQSIGLLNPVTIREDGDQTFLVAGERRLRAIQHLSDINSTFHFNGAAVPLNHAPTITLGELSPLEAQEAEYEENVRREDLSWQERAEAESRLHSLRLAQNPFHTTADTAEEIHGRRDGWYQDLTQKNLIVARYLDDPDVRGAKTAHDAVKVLKRKEAATKNLELAQTVGLTFSAHSHTVLNLDAIEWMTGCPRGTFDVILTDPPYGMNAQDFGDGGGKLGGFTHTYDDSMEDWERLMLAFSRESLRITKPQAHLYLCCDIDRFHVLRHILSEIGWWVHRTPLINYKPNGARVPWPEHGPRRQWEMILYAVKGKKTTKLIVPDVITTRLTEESYSFGAQKPVDLYVDLLKRSTNPGDSVLDPFAGTGTILPAAHSLKCLATAIELDPERYGICLKRLGELP